MNKAFAEITKTTIENFIPEEFDYKLLSAYRGFISDKDYFDFILECKNGGFFFDQSLHIYGFNTSPDFHSIKSVNALLKKEYKNIAEGLLFFGQDLFGNQFSFDLNNNNITFFNIETGDREILAGNYLEWAQLLLGDKLDYLTGHKIAKAWRNEKRLEFDHRLCPKIPFVAGGEYSIDNLYSSPYSRYIEVNAAIARQVFDLPDGTRIKITIKKD